VTFLGSSGFRTPKYVTKLIQCESISVGARLPCACWVTAIWFVLSSLGFRRKFEL
jgi:hypothetical protein